MCYWSVRTETATNTFAFCYIWWRYRLLLSKLVIILFTFNCLLIRVAIYFTNLRVILSSCPTHLFYYHLYFGRHHGGARAWVHSLPLWGGEDYEVLARKGLFPGMSQAVQEQAKVNNHSSYSLILWNKSNFLVVISLVLIVKSGFVIVRNMRTIQNWTLKMILRITFR